MDWVSKTKHTFIIVKYLPFSSFRPVRENSQNSVVSDDPDKENVRPDTPRNVSK